MIQMSGSPGSQVGMSFYNFIVGVNGHRVHDRTSFLKELARVPDETDFTIQSEDWNGKEYIDIIRKSVRAVSLTSFMYSISNVLTFLGSLVRRNL